MMRKDTNIFYAKIMLFGEYSVINNSMALTIPYSHFNGELSFIFNDNYTDYDFAKQSNLSLYNYLGYLRKLNKQSKMLSDFDIDAFSKDLDHGLYFESSIPEGFGVGSSGALIAALYERYAKNKILVQEESERLLELKQQFAQLESFYHGTSSGIDPLNSYLKHPLLFGENKSIKKVDIHLPTKNPEFAVFLINSGNQGKTGPLVNIFLEKTKKNNGQGIDSQHLNNVTNEAIQSIIEGNNKDFFESLQELSAYQLKHFDPMIPEGFRSIWKKGLDQESYFLKLCGSGGGGFLLGFTNDFPSVRKIFEKKDLEVIPVYVHLLP
jgi:mevalonate kinase